MNGFVSLIGALAWPMAALGIALLFRDELKLMMARVGRVKYRDVEVTFRDDLHQAESLARSIPDGGRVVLEIGPGNAAPPGGALIGVGQVARHPGHDGLARLASRSPREAVLESWAELGRALVKAASSLGDRRVPASIRPDDAERFLIDRGWLAGPEAQLVGRLRGLRDRLVHLDEVHLAPDDARRYVDLALPMASKVEALG